MRLEGQKTNLNSFQESNLKKNLKRGDSVLGGQEIDMSEITSISSQLTERLLSNVLHLYTNNYILEIASKGLYFI